MATRRRPIAFLCSAFCRDLWWIHLLAAAPWAKDSHLWDGHVPIGLSAFGYVASCVVVVNAQGAHLIGQCLLGGSRGSVRRAVLQGRHKVPYCVGVCLFRSGCECVCVCRSPGRRTPVSLAGRGPGRRARYERREGTSHLSGRGCPYVLRVVVSSVGGAGV